MSHTMLPIALAVVLLTACTPAATPMAGPASDASPARESRTLVVVTRVEPQVVAPGINVGGGTASGARSLFTAGLAYTDDQDVRHPRVAESMPQLNTDSWRVLPDGRMETTWRLRPGLTWHDGTPLNAEDFVFGWRVRSVTAIGLFAETAGHRLKEEVSAPDSRTVFVRWRAPFPGAEGSGDLDPLPRHLLQEPLEQLAPEVFGSLPYWNREYVGLGPYRLTSWEPGAFIEGTAFAGYALGRPRIDRAVLRWISDPNAVIANMLSGEAHIAVDDALRYQSALTLQRAWAGQSAGNVIYNPDQARYILIQRRPDYANPRAILDVRVRRAFTHAIDRDTLAEALLEGHSTAAHHVISTWADYAPLVDSLTPKYPFDLRRTEQLLGEAGFAKAADGFFASPSEGRLGPELRASSTGQEEQEAAVVLDNWRRAGIDARSDLVAPAQMQVGEVRSTFRSFQIDVTGTTPDTPLVKFSSTRIPTPENRWVGSNRGAYSNPDYDRLFEQFQTTLDRNERNRQVAEMMRIAMDEVAGIPLYYTFSVVAHVAGLSGPAPAAGSAWSTNGIGSRRYGDTPHDLHGPRIFDLLRQAAREQRNLMNVEAAVRAAESIRDRMQQQ